MSEAGALRFWLCVFNATLGFSIAVYIYEAFAYNVIFLGRILPALGRGALAGPFLVIFNLVWGLAFWSHLRAHLTDPGAVPRQWQEFVQGLGGALLVAPPRQEFQPGRATLCRRCNRSRPERAHHCQFCGICVLRYDHHCPWINNCVGYNNHKFFLLLGVYACMASLVALATSLPEIVYCAGAITRMEDGFAWEEKHLETWDVFVFIIFGLLALFVSVLLTPMLATHLPLASQNLTTIEDNYENMPNPFDQGSTGANLAQVFGGYGPDWFFPIAPWRPLSDGVSFARSDERVGPDGLPERGPGDEELEVEKLWRVRYHVRTPTTVIADVVDNGPLTSLARWWNGP
mmetsp:Transcript_34875/g.78832  ORF Transcript_34875/g.78832 Transcript_34875/m.78832 type:complete len:345 (-) Transcript_34875:44-1078(-)